MLNLNMTAKLNETDKKQKRLPNQIAHLNTGGCLRATSCVSNEQHDLEQKDALAVTDSQDRDGKTACGKKIQKHLKLSC